MLQRYPVANDDLIDTDSEIDVEWLKLIVVGIRSLRKEMGIKDSREIPLLLRKGDANDHRRSSEYSAFLKKLAKLSEIRFLENSEKAPLSTTQLVGSMELLVPMAGLIDTDAEIARLTKELDKIQKEIARLEGKLGTASFAANAPADVVEKEKERLAAAVSGQGRIEDQIRQLRGM